MAEFEQRSDISHLPLKRITLFKSVCCVENRLHRGKTISRKISKEAIEIIQVSYDGGLMVAVKFVRSGWILDTF